MPSIRPGFAQQTILAVLIALLPACSSLPTQVAGEKQQWRLLLAYFAPSGALIGDVRRQLLDSKEECEETAGVEMPKYFGEALALQWVCVPDTLIKQLETLAPLIPPPLPGKPS